MTGAIKDAQSNTRFGNAAQTQLNRRDYGITWGKPMQNGGMDVGNEVMIDIQLESMKPAQACRLMDLSMTRDRRNGRELSRGFDTKSAESKGVQGA